jgi:hypothetical protein
MLLRVEVSLFVPSGETEDRDEVGVATGRSTKRPSILNDIFHTILSSIGHELIFYSLQLQ